MTHPADVRAGLRDAGERLAEADRARAEAIHDIARWAAQRRDAGLSVADVARICGVSRQTVYDLDGGGQPERSRWRRSGPPPAPSLTDAQRAELGDVGDVRGWASRAAVLESRDGVTVAAIARAAGLSHAAALQRIRRHGTTKSPSPTPRERG